MVICAILGLRYIRRVMYGFWMTVYMFCHMCGLQTVKNRKIFTSNFLRFAIAEHFDVAAFIYYVQLFLDVLNGSPSIWVLV